MGNCFGFSSAASPNTPPVSAPPAKKQRKEQPFVTSHVEALRNEASTYHQKVVQCAKRSQEAWRKGDKKDAHNLSEEKKSWQRKQDEANRKAAELILEPQKWQISGEIDLHGLYLDEALDATKNFLKHWKKTATVQKNVLIVTGAGHHSKQQKAVIRPKIEELLQNQGLDYESAHGDGAFRVTIAPRQ